MNLREVLQELQIPFKEHGSHHHVSEGWLGTDCPYCSPDTERYRMGFNLRYNYCSCWVCGYKPLYDVLKLLAGKEASLSPLLKQLTKDRTVKVRPKGKLVLPLGLGDLLPAHRRYLAGRRMDSEAMVALWSVQGLGVAPELSWRIFIPIHNRGEMISWTTRAIGDTVQRYINAREDQEVYPAKSTLLGIDHCRHAILVVEGPLDAMKIGYGAVATMGVSYTRTQLLKISKFPVRIVCMDAEPQAQKRAERLCEDLACFEGQTHRVELESGKDASEASDKEIRQLRKHFLE